MAFIIVRSLPYTVPSRSRFLDGFFTIEMLGNLARATDDGKPEGSVMCSRDVSPERRLSAVVGGNRGDVDVSFGFQLRARGSCD